MRRSTGNKRVLEQYEGKNIRRILFSDNPGMLNERGWHSWIFLLYSDKGKEENG